MALRAGGKLMDAPLLALTRRSTKRLSGSLTETIAAKNMHQLIQLRWIAVAGQLAAVLITHFQLGVVLPLLPMLCAIGALALANVILFMALPRHRATDAELFGALLLDVAALTLLLYFSGGATNPFIWLYLLQVVLGAILLPPVFVWIIVAATGLAYGILSTLHLPLALPSYRREEITLLGDWASFALIVVLLVLFIARISRNLRARDAVVGDLAKHAAEEDMIVRMGLLASSAAHELGTPLATLSVILSDWQRHPKLKRDKEFQREIVDMRGEVHRCTAIVADILRSVGETRGESMERRPARDLLESVASDWREANPNIPLVLDIDPVSSARVPAEPALRQALWNILDNAACVSPHQVILAADLREGEVALRIRDEGPGFAPGDIVQVGTPYWSTKGKGHGLGLFLAANVARRLSGRLAVRNLDEGGAEVSIILPGADVRADAMP